jgi:hypothetical protein
MRGASLLLLAVSLATRLASGSTIIEFDLIPTDGTVQGTPGSTVGWGYSITNNDPSLTWVASDFSTGPIADATPSVLFDFPVVLPGQTVQEDFDPVNEIGLLQLIWDETAPEGTLIQGLFVLSGDWYTADPSFGGVFVETGVPVSVAYEASVADPVGAPEPNTRNAIVLCAALAVSWRYLAQFRFRDHR